VLPMTHPTVHRLRSEYDALSTNLIRPRDFRNVRFRLALALMVAGMLFAAGIASAQSTSTEPLSGYTNTTTTETQPATTQKTQTTSPTTEADEETSVAPSVAAQPAASAPSSLAFTGGEPLLLIALGLALTGGTAALMVRERRRGTNN
jgi:carbohydrate-binding DOMON domain-containing protein